MSDISRQVGLLGGSGRIRMDKGFERPEYDTPLFLDPLVSEQHRETLREFLGSDRLQLEIGSGRGYFITDMCQANPEIRFLAIEARSKPTIMTLKRLGRSGVGNVRVLQGDAREYLPMFIPGESLDAVYLMFPDPWWKKKHSKKRIASAPFFQMIADRLKPGGWFIFRSDVPEYWELVKGSIAEGEPRLLQQETLPWEIAKSHRHRKCEELGIPVWELFYKRQ